MVVVGLVVVPFVGSTDTRDRTRSITLLSLNSQGAHTMANIHCRQCHMEYDDQNDRCPNCGRPADSIEHPTPPEPAGEAAGDDQGPGITIGPDSEPEPASEPPGEPEPEQPA